ncbi:ABC transporter permease subunit [Fusibacter bizertensis]
MKKYVSLVVAILVLIAIVFGLNKKDSYDPSAFMVSDVQNNIEKLSAPAFEGRKTGTIGNENAVDFVTAQLESLGLPIYRQTFKALVPETETESFFSYKTSSGSDEWIDLKPHEDYKFSSWGPGGSLYYEGEAIFADNNVYKLDPTWMAGKVVVTEATPFIGESLNTIIDAGAVGALYYTSTYMDNSETFLKQKTLELGSKLGTNFGLGFISRETYVSLKALARENIIKSKTVLPTGTIHGVIDKIKIDQSIEFNSVSTENIYAVLSPKIDQDKLLSEEAFKALINSEDVLIIAANIDHVGRLDDENYFPGALSNASGVAVLVELAKNMTKQKNTDQTVIFAIVNAGETDQQGVQALTNLFKGREEHVQVINLFALGSKADEPLYVSGSNVKSSIAKSKFSRIAEDLGINVTVIRQQTATDYIYQSQGISAVSIFHNSGVINTLEDNASMISDVNLSKDILLLQSYIKAHVYSINPWQALQKNEKYLLIGVIVYLLAMYLLEVFRNQNTFIEKLYFSTPIQLIKKAGSLLTPVSILLLLIFITKLPRDLDVAIVGGKVDTNFSFYLTLKNAIYFIDNLFKNGIDNFDFIANAFKNSTFLFILASLVAIVLGTIKGMFDAYSDKENSDVRSFISLTALSVPDILWILFSNILIIKIASYVEIPILRHLIFPLITLAIMPTIYVSRISYLAFVKEKTQPYYYALKSRGFSKFRIYCNHLLVPVLENVLTSMLGLASVMISNMIIVEYLFDYKGLANFVLIADKSKDEVTFISLIAAISVLYIAFTSIIRLSISLTTSRQKGGGKRV